MRTRLLWVIVALVSLALAPSVAGCASGEATSPGQGSPAAWESTLGVPAPGYDTVDVDGAFQAVTSDESARLVDVREPAEWAEFPPTPAREYRTGRLSLKNSLQNGHFGRGSVIARLDPNRAPKARLAGKSAGNGR